MLILTSFEISSLPEDLKSFCSASSVRDSLDELLLSENFYDTVLNNFLDINNDL